jgi:hypothetical protein
LRAGWISLVRGLQFIGVMLPRRKIESDTIDVQPRDSQSRLRAHEPAPTSASSREIVLIPLPVPSRHARSA